MNGADKLSLQAVQKSSADITLDEVTQVEGFPSEEDQAAAETSVVKTAELDLDIPDSPRKDIFSEIQLLAGTGPNSHLIEVVISVCHSIFSDTTTN